MKAILLTCCALMFSSVSLLAQLTDFKKTNFNKADSVAEAYFGYAVTNLPRLAKVLTEGLLTEEEKFRAIYMWVCSNIEFDYKLFQLNDAKRSKFDTPEELSAWNKKITPLVFRTLATEKKTVCTGYAYLVRELATLAGLPCVIIDGYGRTASSNVRKAGKANHSWNAVKLYDKWYLCDPTWSSGTYDPATGAYYREFKEVYFLADHALFAYNHYPIDPHWMLSETNDVKQGTNTPKPEGQPSLTEFVNAPLTYTGAYEHKLTQLSPATFDIDAVKGEPVSFRFASDQTIENAELSVHGPKTVESFYPSLYKDSTGRYCLDHTFTRKGKHIVHVLLNHAYALTYTVKVM